MAAKQGSLGVEGVISAFFGIMATNYTGNWWWHGFTCLGSGLIVYQLYKPKKTEVEEIMEKVGLTVDNKDRPIQISRYNQWWGSDILLSLPKGLSVDDFNKKAVAIGNALGGKVRFTVPEKGKIYMELITKDLGTDYQFEPQKLGNVLEIPIGYTYKKLITHNFSDKRPNMLVAGTTDFGKSNFMRGAIANIICTRTPQQVKIDLMDFKGGIEFSVFKRCTHVDGFAKTVAEAGEIVDKLVKIMKHRQRLFEQAGVYKIQNYNSKYPDRRLEYRLVVIDEIAVLKQEGKEIEKYIKSKLDLLLSQGRATGIHFILGTQRPTVSVISGDLKANIGAVLCFRTTSRLESRIVLGEECSDAAEISVQGRAIYQDFENHEVQVMVLDERKTEELVRHTYRKEIPMAMNFSGVVKDDQEAR